MRQRAVRAGLLIQLLLAAAFAWPASVAASPASGPHETLDNRYATTEPNAAAGFDFIGSYHAAGDPAFSWGRRSALRRTPRPPTASSGAT